MSKKPAPVVEPEPEGLRCIGCGGVPIARLVGPGLEKPAPVCPSCCTRWAEITSKARRKPWARPETRDLKGVSSG